jgi:hypothetical protein
MNGLLNPLRLTLQGLMGAVYQRVQMFLCPNVSALTSPTSILSLPGGSRHLGCSGDVVVV